MYYSYAKFSSVSQGRTNGLGKEKHGYSQYIISILSTIMYAISCKHTCSRSPETARGYGGSVLQYSRCRIAQDQGHEYPQTTKIMEHFMIMFILSPGQASKASAIRLASQPHE